MRIVLGFQLLYDLGSNFTSIDEHWTPVNLEALFHLILFGNSCVSAAITTDSVTLIPNFLRSEVFCSALSRSYCGDERMHYQDAALGRGF